MASKEVTWEELLDGVLTGDEGWDELYNEYVSQLHTTAGPRWTTGIRRCCWLNGKGTLPSGMETIAMQLRILSNLANEADSKDRRLAAWYKHLEGVAHLCASDQANALQAFTAASLQRFELGRPLEQRDKMFKLPKADSVGFQARRLASQFRSKRVDMRSAVERVRMR